jgi:hypothetical protein
VADLKRQLRAVALDTEADLRRTVRPLRAGLDIDKLTGCFRHSLPHPRPN